MDDMKTPALLALTIAFLTGCAGNPERSAQRSAETRAEKSASEEPAQRSYAGKSIGIAAGGFSGIALGLSSAGVLCTIGGPLCAVILIPAAIVGSVVGGTAGSVVDSVSDSLDERRKASASPASASDRPRADTSALPDG
jgi:hypothetical protein